MIIASFRTKKDKEHLLEKAKKMEEYAAMMVECIEDSEYEDETEYRHHDDEEDYSRYGYRRMNKRMR